MSIADIQPGAKIRFIETAYGKNRGKVRTTTVKNLGTPEPERNIVWINTSAGPLRLDEVLEVVA